MPGELNKPTRPGFERQLAKGAAEERDVHSYLKALGWLLVPAMNYSRGGAPLIEGDTKSLIMPDALGIKGGAAAWFECKWKARAVERRTHGGRLYTGIDQHSYDHYRHVQDESGRPVVVIFLHEQENEVRCGTLAELDRSQAPHCTQAQYPGSKGGMHNWWYLDVPIWMPYSELKAFVATHREQGRASWPISDLPIAGCLRPIRPEIQIPLFGGGWGR